MYFFFARHSIQSIEFGDYLGRSCVFSITVSCKQSAPSTDLCASSLIRISLVALCEVLISLDLDFRFGI